MSTDLLANSIVLLLIITFIIGVYNYKNYKHTFNKYFLYFLGYGIATEIFGANFYKLFDFSNHIVYNFYALVQFLFYLWLFSKYLKNSTNKKIVKYFKYLTFLFFVINSLFAQSIIEVSQSYFFFFSGILLIITILLFFVEILNSDSILKIKNLLIFWIAIGVLLFQLGFIPVFMAHKYINYTHGFTYGYILLLLNIISCGSFSLGFIWAKKGVDY